MSDDPDHERNAALKKVSADFYAQMRAVTIQQASDASKWTSAALLTINGGGTIAALSYVEKGGPVTSAIAFAIGIVSVLAGTWVSGKISLNYIGTSIAGEVHSLSGNLEFDPSEGSRDFFTFVDILDCLSALMFLVGSVLLASSLPNASNDRRCLAIQRDMLSARPRRPDSPDLFQALGCRPQGEGSVYAPPVRAS